MENTLTIHGMTCEKCVRKIKDSVNTLKGIESLSITSQSEQATICYNENETNLEEIKQAVLDAGYQVE